MQNDLSDSLLLLAKLYVMLNIPLILFYLSFYRRNLVVILFGPFF